MVAFANFMKVNGLKRKDIASFLGVSGAFITQISRGDRPLPEDKLAMIKANAYGWDTSMLTASHRLPLEGLDGIRQHSEITQDQLRSAIEKAFNPEEKFLIGYLERKVKEQEALIKEKDSLINELYKQLGKYEAMLGSERKGELA